MNGRISRKLEEAIMKIKRSGGVVIPQTLKTASGTTVVANPLGTMRKHDFSATAPGISEEVRRQREEMERRRQEMMKALASAAPPPPPPLYSSPITSVASGSISYIGGSSGAGGSGGYRYYSPSGVAGAGGGAAVLSGSAGGYAPMWTERDIEHSPETIDACVRKHLSALPDGDYVKHAETLVPLIKKSTGSDDESVTLKQEHSLSALWDFIESRNLMAEAVAYCDSVGASPTTR